MDTPCPHCDQTTPHTIEKYCFQCAKTLPHTAFNSNKAMADGLHQCCKLCRKRYRKEEWQRTKALMAEDPIFAEQFRARLAKVTASYTKRNPEKAAAASARYHKENPDKINKRRRERYAENPAKPLANNKKRKARIRGASQNDLTAAQWQAIKEHYGHRCVYCGRKMQRLTQDHITPVSQGGAHTVQNIVPACATCNGKKHTGPVLKPIQPLLFI